MKKKHHLIPNTLMLSLEKMLEAEWRISKFERAASSTGVVELEVPALGLFDHVLSIIGFPEDNTTTVGSDEIPWHEHPECFCRDWLSDKWVDEVLEDRMTIQEYIAWAQSELHSTTPTAS